MDMCEHGLSHPINGPRADANDLTGIQKCIGEVSLPFQLQLNTRGFLSDPKDKKLKHRGREKGVELYLEKTVCGHTPK
jgi:hypothetical protein